ncbi:SDR family NAD(P)-dependent oxidoreductase [Variovorax sp. 54]|uniref:SDR family NAD(P)-dependent oxidoreductase n=1 Tax=Variovorax sp. 54 TaxID=2035212 RepID=UPI00211E4C9E|nr:SDR family NAD(P)-dependent oxidoreductase [Variovorax sp. 54]
MPSPFFKEQKMGKLEGKTALVSGAAQGMGEAIARLFVKEGAQVVIADIAAEAARQLAHVLGDAARAVALDVRDPASWTAAVATAEQAFGRLDILVNNAGVLAWQSIEAMTLDSYRRVIDVNQVGCWLGMKAALPALRRAGGGAIVNIASLAGRQGMRDGSAYVASKHAVLGMSKCAALEFGPDNIRVNAVLPGAIATQMAGLRAATTGEPAVPVYAKQPIPRRGTPEEVARLVAFLASDEAAYCTGAEVTLDGGMSLG